MKQQIRPLARKFGIQKPSNNAAGKEYRPSYWYEIFTDQFK